ncbi:DUF1467 family protein [Croceicoccus naphthovorans]|uniref:Uncharacterized protein n=1 Tax=Croceicoccus naphthovorans TaxID=1348774 RepID=A0A0G3XH45_9SPHN|nr:DUF1467 family protein [Croceicoccus naphthovorans]AKM09956.1 hypothetical protein AB433_08145 [Croceicoccus naphthovorans]MBB3990884.1 putative secreted protein [Croceicoccus naphthovorans]
MQWTSVLAIYLLFWVMSAFLVMPFGIRTHRETGEELIAGQADSAPANFRPGRVAVRASILAAILCAAFYFNYEQGWITASDINFISPPADIVKEQELLRAASNR